MNENMLYQLQGATATALDDAQLDAICGGSWINDLYDWGREQVEELCNNIKKVSPSN